MKNTFRLILSKAPLLFAGLMLSAVFTLSDPTDVMAATFNASNLINGHGTGSTVKASDIENTVGSSDNIVLNTDLTINIDTYVTIGQITWDGTFNNYTLTITGTETLTCKKIGSSH